MTLSSPSDRSSRRNRLTPVLAAGFAVATAVALASPATAAPAVGDIRYADSPTAITDSYLVVLADDAIAARAGTSRAAVAVPARATELADRYGGSVTRVYHSAVNGFQVRLGEQAARRLAASPDVAYVEQDRRVTVTGTQTDPPSWGLDRIDQRNLPLDAAYTYPNQAPSVRAYVIDTGIRLNHRDFGKRATSGFDAVDGGTADDCNGHGTHVAGTVAGTAHGVAKQALLVAVRVLDCSGSGTTAGVVAGVDWVTANAIKPAVANMSLGGGASAVLDDAVTNSIASGVTYTLAAGNSNSDACNYSPARTPTAITVGNTNQADNRAPSSNYGPCLDLFAPGTLITSAWHTSRNATNTISGTSMAAPHAAGAAALLLHRNPLWTPQQVRDQLVADATPNVVVNPGPGSPNHLLHVAN